MLNLKELEATIGGLTLPIDTQKMAVMFKVCTEDVPQLISELNGMYLTFAQLHGGNLTFEPGVLTVYSPQDAEIAQLKQRVLELERQLNLAKGCK